MLRYWEAIMLKKLISKKADEMNVSGVRKMFEAASKLKDPIDLSVGQPDFDVPDIIKDEAKKAIDMGLNKYVPTKGMVELRNKIRSKLQEKNGITVDIENIFVTSAGSGALTLAFASILDKDDEIIIFDPYFVAYEQLAILNEAKPIFVETNNDFSLNFEYLKKAITKKTKAIILNTPGNPTGYVFTKKELTELVNICKENDLIIISDEMYEDFIYDHKHFSVGSIYEKTISIFGFSKSHSMTGWRVGYFTAPKDIIDAATKISQFTFVCAPTPFQYACIKAVDHDMKKYVDEYKEKRDFLYDSLKDKYEFEKPEGAFYAFIKYPYDPKRFINDCLDKNLLVVPGNVFSKKNTHFRISFAVCDETLKKATSILNRLVK
ncbi:aspartate aminotransferase [Candidatus Woesearchaeota archaeon]|nr:MAG: aspartate aminotransferase [Candidatus Woesearchaeota archaeon]